MKWKLLTTIAILLLPMAAYAGYIHGELSPRVDRYDAVETKHGYAILYRFEGKEYSVAFRVRPHNYPAYSVQCWVIEGHDAEYADELLEKLDDEIWLTGGDRPLIQQRWNREVK